MLLQPKKKKNAIAFFVYLFIFFLPEKSVKKKKKSLTTIDYAWCNCKAILFIHENRLSLVVQLEFTGVIN